MIDGSAVGRSYLVVGSCHPFFSGCHRIHTYGSYGLYGAWIWATGLGYGQRRAGEKIDGGGQEYP